MLQPVFLPESTRATLSISNSASGKPRAMSRGDSKTGAWATVTIRLSTEAVTLKRGGDSRKRMSEMRWVHDAQCRFDIRKMDVALFFCP